ncbi:hypothetical protein QJQ45_028089 [Haematococcus lacustris]|nr:hypothetical protein QJQ45_028089 [Haematococcus lacustris]
MLILVHACGDHRAASVMNNNKLDEPALLAGCRGVFAKTSYITIGNKDKPEEYGKKVPVRTVYGGKHFTAIPGKEGHTTDVYFEKKHNWISDGDKYVDRWRYKEQQPDKKKGFLTSDFSKRDEFSNTTRTEQWREQLQMEGKFAKKAVQMFSSSAGMLESSVPMYSRQEEETFLYDSVFDKEDPGFRGASKTHRDTKNRTMLSHDRTLGGTMTYDNHTEGWDGGATKVQGIGSWGWGGTWSPTLTNVKSLMDTSVDVDTLFRLFTVPLTDFVKTTLILDVRDQKSFKRGHVNQAYCVRLSTNGKVLADYSGAEYALPWSQDVWVGRDVFVYGSAGLKRDHCVLDFLSKAGCRSLRVFKEGYEAFKTAYPALCTPSIKANSYKQYPSQARLDYSCTSWLLIISGLLYLGDWSHAEAIERLQEELGIQAVVTVHNHPENLKPKLPKGVRWLPWSLADVDTADISPCFHRTFEFIEDARNRKQAVLVHCGAGVSRSATLCMMYLMRRNHWNAETAKKYCVQRRQVVEVADRVVSAGRSVVCPNDGFWRTLCALEPTLGITSRSDPDATTGFLGVDAPAAPAVLSADVVGGKVPVTLLTGNQAAAHDLKRKVESDGVSSGADDRSAKRSRGEAGAGATTGAGAAESNDLPPGHNGKGLVVTLEVSKPEGLVGQLVVGPMGPHQRVIFGRLPTADVVLEHQSLSRQHAALAVEGTAGLTLTDLQSGPMGLYASLTTSDIWFRAGSRHQAGGCVDTTKHRKAPQSRLLLQAGRQQQAVHSQVTAHSLAGTTLDSLQALKATWDVLWEEYLKPRWRWQRLELHHAQERVIEGFCKKEYQQSYKRVNDRLSKGRQRLHRAAEYRRGIDGRARNNA